MDTDTVFARRVLVVDDESIIRFLLTSIFTRLGLECASAKNAVEAIKVARTSDPDVALVDLDLGSGASGVELITSLRLHNPAIGIVLLSNFLPKKTEQLSLDRVTYLHKSEVENEQVLEEHLADSVRLAQARKVRVLDKNAERIQGLTRNQQETLALLAKGLTNSEIASKFEITVAAVENTVSRIYKRLNISGVPVGARRVEAANLYLKTIGGARSGSA
jgi:DNA-binding NarL/FixJ family response regulator